MKKLSERLDLESVTVTFLPLPKGRRRGNAIGFCATAPIATLEAAGGAPPWRWVNGKPEVLTYETVKRLTALGAAGRQVVGHWTTPKGDEHGLLWSPGADGAMHASELHPKAWQKSWASACDGRQQIGFGYENFAKMPSRALVWSGTAESVVVLLGRDGRLDSQARGVCDGIQVGRVGSRGAHACLWRGTSESFVDLHPADERYQASEAIGVGDGQQVGLVMDAEFHNRAALWAGTATSFVDLAPDGFLNSRAWACAQGLQIGFIQREERGMLIRAALWNGSKDDFLDLQQFLPEAWNASQALGIDIGETKLRIIGTAQQAVKSGGYEMNAGQVPVLWELTLRDPALRARPEAPGAPAVVASTASTSDEHRMDALLTTFGDAIVAGDYKSAHGQLAPWLQKEITAEKLQTVLERVRLEETAFGDVVVSGNDSTLDELRSHYGEYHRDDRSRTFTTVDEFGEWGPPSIYLNDEITNDNFRQWSLLEFTPDPDAGSELDYLLRLWIIVVDVNAEMRIGHLEPGD